MIKLFVNCYNRWVVKYSPFLESEFKSFKKSVGKNWKMDETYIKVRGEWVYLYRAVDKEDRPLIFSYLLLVIKKRLKPSLKKQLVAVDCLRKSIWIKAVPIMQP